MKPGRSSAVYCAVVQACLSAAFIARAAGTASSTTAMVRIVQGGKTQWRVGLPPEAGIVERFAAEELKKYVTRMSGAALSEADRLDRPKTILVGRRDQLRCARLDLMPRGYDGYTISVSPDTVVIAGMNARGVVYGVYALLAYRASPGA